jgi:hypothetical protein
MKQKNYNGTKYGSRTEYLKELAVRFGVSENYVLELAIDRDFTDEAIIRMVTTRALWSFMHEGIRPVFENVILEDEE